MPPRHIKYGRRDANQAELDEAARRLGWTVYDTSQVAQFVPGFPDAMWAVRYEMDIPRAGRIRAHGCVLVEYKVGDAGLTPEEEAFRDGFPGPYEVCRTLDDVERITKRWWLNRLI